MGCFSWKAKVRAVSVSPKMEERVMTTDISGENSKFEFTGYD